MADPIVETTMFDRHFDGMAGESDMPRKLVARLCWLKRAEIAERDQKELRDSLVNVLALACIKFGNLDAGANEVFANAEALLANYSDEVVV